MRSFILAAAMLVGLAGAQSAWAETQIQWFGQPALKGTPDELEAALGDSATEVIVMAPGEMRRFGSMDPLR